MAGKIMSLWIYSSILEVSWEGSVVLPECLCMAQDSEDLVQPGQRMLQHSLGVGSVKVGA